MLLMGLLGFLWVNVGIFKDVIVGYRQKKKINWLLLCLGIFVTLFNLSIIVLVIGCITGELK
jgi:hypothetical protein